MLDLLKSLSRTAALATVGLTFMAGTSVAQDALTLEAIQADDIVQVGTLVDFPPFGFMNESNEPDGLDVDVAKEIAARMGVELELVPVTGPNRIPFLQTGKIDLVIGALTITDERAEQVLFSDPYSALQAVLYARKDLDISSYDNLGGLSIGVARASPQDTVVTNDAPESTNIQRFDEISAVYQAVLAEQIDGAALGTLIAIELNQQTDAFETKFPMYQSVQGVAMLKGSDALAETINGYLADMVDDGTLNEISLKWLETELPELTSDL